MSSSAIFDGQLSQANVAPHAFPINSTCEDAEILAASLLFNTDWYLSQGPVGVERTDDRVRIAQHYLAVGADAGLSPSPHFDREWYQSAYEDVARLGCEPFMHFLKFGMGAGYDPNANFVSDWYRLYYPEVARSNAIPIEHYVTQGKAEGRLTSPPKSKAITRDATMDWAVKPASMMQETLSYDPTKVDGIGEFRGDMLQFSLADGSFDEWTYLYHNADVAHAVANGSLVSGYEHFVKYGEAEYRNGTRKVPQTTRELSYLLRNPDAASLIRNGDYRNGFVHWQDVGRREELIGLRQRFLSGASDDCSEFDISTWRDGYVILPSIFTAGQCDDLVEMIEKLWHDRTTLDLPINMESFLDRVDGNKPSLVRNAPDEAYDHPFKINNLYFWSYKARSMVLDERLCRVLRRLLGGDPTVMTSLNFRKGSQQAMHLDTFYMPPVIPYRMVASWIALEDVYEENGPLAYIPGTNRIPPYYFEGHRLWTKNTQQEYDDFDRYFHRKIDEHGLNRKKLLIKKGDVLIWHSLLLHGGEAIINPDLTRWSMVAHYFVAADYPGGSSTKLPTTKLQMESYGRYYEDRWPQFAPLPK